MSNRNGRADVSSLSSPGQLIAGWMACPMFALSLVFLVLLAGLIVVWIDMPGVVPDSVALAEMQEAPAADENSANSWLHQRAHLFGYYLVSALCCLWPIFWLEPIVCHWFSRRRAANFASSWKLDLCVAICPPLRLAKPIREMDDQIWLPMLGWNPPGKPLAKLLERVFSKPMLVIALLILPVLLIEFGFSSQVESHVWLRLALNLGTGLIWCAFTLEFIVMISATEKKLAYAKDNWIDLAIILLPLISFMRSLRVVRAIKMAQYAQIQQLAKMSRVYRMRGLFAKTVRALLVLEVLHRLFRITPEKRLKKLEFQLAEKQDEIAEIQDQIDTLKQQISVTEASKDSHNRSRKLMVR